jgi:hypothetical protein
LLDLITRLLSEEIVSCDLKNYTPDAFELFRDSYPNNQVPLVGCRVTATSCDACWCSTT